MGSGNERSNTKRPALGESDVVTLSSGEAVISCETNTRSPAIALVDPLQLPISCSVKAVGRRVLLYSNDQALAELSDRALVERLVVCIRRGFDYRGVLRREEGRVIADVIGG